jgi:hypothetical protein
LSSEPDTEAVTLSDLKSQEPSLMRYLEFSVLQLETTFFYWRRSILMYIVEEIRAQKLAFERKDAVERETLKLTIPYEDGTAVLVGPDEVSVKTGKTMIVGQSRWTESLLSRSFARHE